MLNTKNRDMKYNDSGCKDMTAYEALRSIQKEKRRKLISAIKALAKEQGYRIVNVIELEEEEGNIDTLK